MRMENLGRRNRRLLVWLLCIMAILVCITVVYVAFLYPAGRG